MFASHDDRTENIVHVEKMRELVRVYILVSINRMNVYQDRFDTEKKKNKKIHVK